MLLPYRDPRFWETFHARHWEPQVPTVIRQPFKKFPFSEELLLRALNSFATGIREGDHRKPCLVSVGDSETAPRRPIRALFKKTSDSLESLEQNCDDVFSKKKFGLMVNEMQASDPGIWNAVTSFLQDGRKFIGSPPRAFFDLFYGNYSSTFTGLHKDTQEIIAFVVRGEKRMLAWPFEYFLSRVKGLTPGDKYFNKRLAIDHRKYRKDALVLDARAGDIIYWPSDYWHVSETQRGQYSAMISLGLFRPQGPHTKPPPLVSRDMTGETRPDAGGHLRWLTGFGFGLGGPFAEQAPEAKTVVKNKSSVILWKRDSSTGRLLIATNGHSISLPQSTKLLKLLEKLSHGESVTAGSKRPQAKRSTVFETNWDKMCELTTRKRTSRDDSAWLVDWLLRTYAVNTPG